MCGIAGFFHPAGERRESLAWLERMATRIAHRGPDAQGVWWDAGSGVGLAHRRLSILDLSPAGAQPMVSHCGRWVIAYNGEIYNHRELRRRIEAAGPVAWRGHSDTEVLLESLARQGLDATLDQVDGMFAFAAFDRGHRQLHLARDRFGEKPLYYGRVGEGIAFGSELKALRALPGFRGGVDQAALQAFLRHGYVPAPLSIHPGIFKLAPAHVLSLSGPGSLPAPRAYWSAADCARTAAANPFEGDLQSAAGTLDALLRDAIGLRMEADVPLGALLSGGIDSSTVVALMQAQRSDRVRTFSIGSTEHGYDEAGHARAIAAHLGTEHTELYVSAGDALALVPILPTLYDEPFADSSQLPTFLVSRMARQHVTVALSGDAGDELFGGYNRHFHGPALWRRLAPWPAILRRAGAALVSAISPGGYDRLARLAGPLAPRELAAGRAGEKVHKAAGLLSAADEADFHARLVSLWPEPWRLLPGASPLPSAVREDGPSWGFAERSMLHDTCHYLPDDVLAKVDRASMGVSLEVRVPLLDRRVFEFAWRLPMQYKAPGGQGKRVLREVLYRHVPRELVDRPKQGFAVPVAAWLRGPLREWADDLLAPGALDDRFDARVVGQAWRAHLAGSRNHDTRLWAVLMFQAWRRQWGEG